MFVYLLKTSEIIPSESFIIDENLFVGLIKVNL